MSNVDVIGLFKQAALEVHGRELGTLEATTEISTLGLDSVAVMEMTGCLEEKLKIRIPDEELAEVQTLGELDTLIRRVMASTEAP
jgi:acyl carrier protein